MVCVRRHADALLQNVWRWLCASPPDSTLAHPGLKAAVTELKRKTLAQLVADMRRLGATVVAADASSVILSTGKRNLTAAIGWVLGFCVKGFARELKRGRVVVVMCVAGALQTPMHCHLSCLLC